jgi:hypothetical protein
MQNSRPPTTLKRKVGPAPRLPLFVTARFSGRDDIFYAGRVEFVAKKYNLTGSDF